MWIELRKSSFFSRRLRCDSDLIASGTYTFEYADRKMLVKNGEVIVVGTDGWSYLATELGVMQVERKQLKITALAATNENHSIEWSGDNMNVVTVRSSLRSDKSFLITHNTSTPSSIFFTRVRLEQEGLESKESVERLGIALLAFFWTFYENDRTSFA
jgi:hypothetical protein